MEKLFAVDFGLMLWTVVTFVLLLVILGRFGWGPLLSALKEREDQMKLDLDGARAARDQAEKIKNELEAEMAQVQVKTREMIAQVTREGEALSLKLKSQAESDAQKIKDKATADLANEKERLVRELRRDVADISLQAAEKIMRKSVDASVQKSTMESFFSDLEKQRQVS